MVSRQEIRKLPNLDLVRWSDLQQLAGCVPLAVYGLTVTVRELLFPWAWFQGQLCSEPQDQGWPLITGQPIIAGHPV